MLKETNINIPQLRFPEFKGEWEEKKLGEIATNRSGKYNPEKEINSIKCIELEHLASESGQLLGYVDGKNSGSIKNKFDRGDVLFGKLRPYLKKYLLAPFDGVCSSEIWVLRGTKISNDFLFRIVQTNDFIDLANQSSGSKMPRADWSVVENGLFFYPSIPEQSKIATFLTAVDEKLQALKKKKSLLEKYKKGAMQKLFSQELRFQSEDGKEFGEWEEKKLGEIYSFKITNSYSRENLNYNHGITKNIHYGDIHTKFQSHFNIINEKVPFINPEISLARINEDNYCKEGDLILADASEDLTDVGKSIELVHLNNEKLLSGLHTILARPNLEKFVIGFGGHLLRSNNIRTQIMKESQGSKVLSISITRLSNILLRFPSKEEQILIANFLSSLDEKINHTQTEITKTEVWKRGLLQKMFV